MIDPISALATATAVFNGVKKAVKAGQEAEAIFRQMGKWWSAVSALNEHEERVKNPPIFKKLLHSKSVEQEAMDAVIRRKKIAEQEKELREMICYAYGIEAYREMLQERRKIKDDREKMGRRQAQRRSAFLQNLLYGVLLLLCSYGLYWIVDFIIGMWPKGK